MRSPNSQKPPVHDTEVTNYSFSKVSVDITGPLPQTLAGNRYILAFVCCLTGYIEAFGIENKNAETIAQILIDEIFNRYSSPRMLLSDNGSEFVNDVIRYVTKELSIPKIETSFYSPNSKGKVERFNRMLKNVL